MQNLRKDFPILIKNSLVYLDSAATSLKPQQVIESVASYYSEIGATVHRGIYKSSVIATNLYENTRDQVAKFIGANSAREIIFVRNTTEAINLVAYTWGEKNTQEGDEIITTIMEHHSNFVPWQRLAERKKAKLKVVGLTEDGHLDMENFNRLLSKRVKLICVTGVSNVLGTINPITKITQAAKMVGAKVLVDGAQMAPHMKVDVENLGCDFFAFSGHKMLGPTGIGVLWAREELLNGMEPFLSGGGMINEVTVGDTTYADLPLKFEAGTPNIDGVIGLGAAIDYLNKIGMEKVRSYEEKLVEYGTGVIGEVRGVRVFGPEKTNLRGGVISFTVDKIHPHDLASILDEQNIAIRAGHHCCMPLHGKLGVPSTARASFYIYNTKTDVDRLVEGINKAKKILK